MPLPDLGNDQDGGLSNVVTLTPNSSATAAKSSSVHCVCPFNRAETACRLIPRASAMSCWVNARRAIHARISVETWRDTLSESRLAGTPKPYDQAGARRQNAIQVGRSARISCILQALAATVRLRQSTSVLGGLL